MRPVRMSFVEHFADLRRRLIFVLVVFVVWLAVCLAFVNRIYRYLVQPIAREHLRLVAISPGEVVLVCLSVAGVAAIGLTLPFALWQIWLFVAPGLTQAERRYTLRLLPVTLLMFVAGVCFAWFWVFPTILHVLIHLAQDNLGLGMMIHVGSYFSFLTSVCLPFGFVFELPIVVVFLTRIGVVTPTWLRKFRRYAYFIIVVVGVFISPPELITHLSVILPMILLYEVSILLSVSVRRRVERDLA